MGYSDEIRKRKIRNRKRQLWKYTVYLVNIVLFCTSFFYIRTVNRKLREVQIALEQVKVLQHENNYFLNSENNEQNYVDSIADISVEKPQKRTETEVMETLKALGDDYPEIKEIYENAMMYPEDMLAALVNNPEMVDFVAGYLNHENIPRRLTQKEFEQEFPLFLQWDTRWGYQEYGDADSNIGLSGCGPTCLSMVLYYLTDDEMLTPDRIAAYSMENGYYAKGVGTAWALMEDMPELYDIHVSKPKLNERIIKAQLDQGKVIICAMGAGDFTLSGHFIVIYGYTEQGFRVNDPNCVARSRKTWTFEELEPQIKSIWSYGVS